jgi:Flp pilus assembly protein TadB
MNEPVIFLLIAIGIMSLLSVAGIFAWPYIRGGDIATRFQGLKNNRGGMADDFEDPVARMARSGIEGGQLKMSSSELTLEKKLTYAQWKMTPRTYKIYCALITAFFFMIALLKLNFLWWTISLFSGSGIMATLVARSMSKRFKQFDRDYAPFLLSLVGLLRTGMNPLQALGTASASLESDSLVRFEVELMLERIRAGAPEDKSVGAFGSDVAHPEIELFVQALLLSMRVGGTLSDTLERLSKQVRRRQYFRSQAVAAIGLQRGSIWFIVAIQVGLMSFIYFILPKFITESVSNPMGWQVWQFGIFVMFMGMFWVSKVSKIRC